MDSVTIRALPGIPDIRPGDDLAAIIGDALDRHAPPRAGDVICVAQKVFSKAEGRVLALADIRPSRSARRYGAELNKDPRKVEAVLRESRQVVRAFRHPGQDSGTMICEHRLGFICANAAVDESNTDTPDTVILLPEDPDASAASLCAALQARFGQTLAVVMTDTFGRPWRIGQVNVAIGLSQLPATRREQGQEDAWGRKLAVTEPALADEIAAAAGLVMHKAAKTPVVVVRGLDWQPRPQARARDLLRPVKEDTFR
ncbi:coenzyme F420-0:L-glutamate ligase [Paracoccus jiaweipingae]|uniref:coenzyme F420-0:L-glutamate ligase n=1 Tax=unclassified Paracoccus (in: a-proteobacteria) TaxID=2688777 RepID=UPI0037AE4C60